MRSFGLFPLTSLIGLCVFCFLVCIVDEDVWYFTCCSCLAVCCMRYVLTLVCCCPPLAGSLQFQSVCHAISTHGAPQ